MLLRISWGEVGEEKNITVKSRPAILWILNGTTEIQGSMSGDDFCTHQENPCSHVCSLLPKESIQYFKMYFL